jgi:hypothetical protein
MPHDGGDGSEEDEEDDEDDYDGEDNESGMKEEEDNASPPPLVHPSSSTANRQSTRIIMNQQRSAATDAPPPPPQVDVVRQQPHCAPRMRVSKCWLCTFANSKMAKQVSSFVSANAGCIDPTIMADQIKREVMREVSNQTSCALVLLQKACKYILLHHEKQLLHMSFFQQFRLERHYVCFPAQN